LPFRHIACHYFASLSDASAAAFRQPLMARHIACCLPLLMLLMKRRHAFQMPRRRRCFYMAR